MDSVACLAVMCAVLFLVIHYHGADLAAPADPSEPYSAARPEWYFLFLFQFLKYFPGTTELIGAIIIPSLALGVIFLMPLLGRWKLGHRFNLGFLVAILAGAGLLTWLAKKQDAADPVYIAAVKQASAEAERVQVLAQSPTGIPPAGAVTLLRTDPLTQGPKIFAKNCASCHRYDGHDGTGAPVKEVATGADLKGFASREWLAGLLDPARADSAHYFGGTKFKDGKMVRFVKKTVGAFDDAKKANLKKVIYAISAEAGLKSQAGAEKSDASGITEGRSLVLTDEMRCTECHTFRGKGEDPTGPDLTGFGSKDWLVAFVSDPAHERFYGKRNDRMPSYGRDKSLDETSIGLVVDWLRGDWYEPAVPAR